MSISKAKQLSLNICATLQTITILNGYTTDIGTTVLRGTPKQTDASVPCIYQIEGEDKTIDDPSTFNMPAMVKPKITLGWHRFIIEAHLDCDPDNPNDAAHDAIADIKRAIFGGDRTFDGIARAVRYISCHIGKRQDGNAVVPAYVQFDVQFPEDLTNP